MGSRAAVLIPHDPTHSGVTVARFVAMHLAGGSFLLAGAIVFFGWRALGCAGLVVGSTLLGAALWRRVGRRGTFLHTGRTAWMALLLAFTLPAEWFSQGWSPASAEGVAPLWPLAIVAGLLLSACLWLLGGFASGRVHPVLVVHLLLVGLAAGVMTPTRVLAPPSVATGDLLSPRVASADSVERPEPRAAGGPGEPWFQQVPLVRPDTDAATPDSAGLDPVPAEAIERAPASDRLILYTTGRSLGPASVPIDALVRDQLPPIQDLIIGGHPAPLGLGSVIAVIVGGLALCYRGLVDHRVPLLVIACAWVTWAVAPVPVLVSAAGVEWTWLLPLNERAGAVAGVTFVNYQLMAGPLVFVAFFLATSPATRPLSRRARWAYACLIGVLAALAQLYISVAFGPYLAMLLVCLVAPYIDRGMGAKPMV